MQIFNSIVQKIAPNKSMVS